MTKNVRKYTFDLDSNCDERRKMAVITRKIYRRIITPNNNAFDILVQKVLLYQNGCMNFFEKKHVDSKFHALSRGAISFYVSLLV